MAHRDQTSDFEGRRGGEPWRAEGRYGSAYGPRRRAAGAGGYGQEGGPGHRTTGERDPAWRGDEREVWRPGDGAPYGDLELNPRNRGVQAFGPPADYAYHPPAGHEFDPDYLRWREARMRAHDRDYQEWRRDRQQRYDAEYRRTRDAGDRR